MVSSIFQNKLESLLPLVLSERCLISRFPIRVSYNHLIVVSLKSQGFPVVSVVIPRPLLASKCNIVIRILMKTRQLPSFIVCVCLFVCVCVRVHDRDSTAFIRNGSYILVCDERVCGCPCWSACLEINLSPPTYACTTDPARANR